MLVIQSKQLYRSVNWCFFSIHINKESRFGEENPNHEDCKQVSTSYISQIFQACEVGAGESWRKIELIKLLLRVCLMINCEVATPIGSQKFRRGKALPKDRPWYSQINLFLSLPVGIWQLRSLSSGIQLCGFSSDFFLCLEAPEYFSKLGHLQMYILIQSVTLSHPRPELLNELASSKALLSAITP